MAEKHSDDKVETDLNINLEEFVTKFTLPRFARVKEGFYDTCTPKQSKGELYTPDGHFGICSFQFR